MGGYAREGVLEGREKVLGRGEGGGTEGREEVLGEGGGTGGRMYA